MSFDSDIRASPCEPPEPEHDCLECLGDGRNDRATPDHIISYECEVCGQFWEFDVQTGDHTVDNGY